MRGAGLLAPRGDLALHRRARSIGLRRRGRWPGRSGRSGRTRRPGWPRPARSAPGCRACVSAATRPLEFCRGDDQVRVVLGDRLDVRGQPAQAWSSARPPGSRNPRRRPRPGPPAPTAYRSSVAVGESETILAGLALIVTGPLAAVTVTGKTGAGGAPRGRRGTAVLAAAMRCWPTSCSRPARPLRRRLPARRPRDAGRFGASSATSSRYDGQEGETAARPGTEDLGGRDGSPFPRGSISSTRQESTWLRPGEMRAITVAGQRRNGHTGFTGFAP